jgi:hypothetical protein
MYMINSTKLKLIAWTWWIKKNLIDYSICFTTIDNIPHEKIILQELIDTTNYYLQIISKNLKVKISQGKAPNKKIVTNQQSRKHVNQTAGNVAKTNNPERALQNRFVTIRTFHYTLVVRTLCCKDCTNFQGYIRP